MGTLGDEEGEIDLLKAKERDILIMGTNEHAAPCDMRSYGLLTALHLMMEHKVSIVDDRIHNRISAYSCSSHRERL